MPLELRSHAFPNGGEIPAAYTADGENVSPPLTWSGVPPGTKSLALVVEDPDAPDPRAPKRTWVHWVIVDLPVDATELPEHASGAVLPHGAREGKNDWREVGYGGPSPPIGRHRYVHRLFALDAPMASLDHPTKAELFEAMKGHLLAEAKLVGTYERR